MSEQPINIYDLNSYRQSRPNGELEMGPETDVSFHTSVLPLRRAADIQPVHEKTDAEKQAEAIYMASLQLHALKDARNKKLVA